MQPHGDQLPLDPRPFIALFAFGVVVGGIGRLYRSRLLEGVGMLAIGTAAVAFPLAEWLAR